MDKLGLIVVIAVAIAFVTPYLYMYFSAVCSVGKPAPPLEQIIGNEINTDQPIYFYFMSKNCSMCKSMTPIIESLGSDNPNIITIDINQFPEMAKDFHVYGTPTLISVKNGLINKVKLGKLGAKKIDQFIND
jgi:thioredoxin 1